MVICSQEVFVQEKELFICAPFHLPMTGVIFLVMHFLFQHFIKPHFFHNRKENYFTRSAIMKILISALCLQQEKTFFIFPNQQKISTSFLQAISSVSYTHLRA